MPFRYAVAEDGRTGDDLRRHRGVHLLHATGQVQRLALLLPILVCCNSSSSHAILDFRLALFLTASFLALHDDAKLALVYAMEIGIERLGTALDRVLMEIKGDEPRSPSVLRVQLRDAARVLRANGDYLACTVRMADLYEIASSFPTGLGVDDSYDWFAHVTLFMLLDAEKLLAAYCHIALAISDRFDSALALAPGGSINKLSRAVTKAYDPADIDILTDLAASELAVELCSFLARVLPFPDGIAEYNLSVTATLLNLRRFLVSATAGTANALTPANIGLFVPHHELLSRTVGPNVSATVAMGMVGEVVRLVHGTTPTILRIV